VDYLEETMKGYWRQIKLSKPGKDNDKEMQLSGFGGMCYLPLQAIRTQGTWMSKEDR
jgi:hypothetical protein